ncbi:MAG: SIMPL domain-containing protein [Acidobacteriaceae bacterium]
MRRAVLLTAGVAMLLGAARAQTIQVDKNNRTIAVTANDKASAPADTAVVTVGFQTYAPDAATAYSQGSTLSNAILEALKKAGVADKAVESQDQKLAYTEFPENDKSTPEQRAQKQFTLSQSWTVKAGATDAAKVLHAAIEAGANESGNIDWDLTDRNGLQAQAAEKALVRARQMAAGLGAHLGALIYASNQTPVQRFLATESSAETVMVSATPAPPPPLAIRPQQVEESATVYAVFAIE